MNHWTIRDISLLLTMKEGTNVFLQIMLNSSAQQPVLTPLSSFLLESMFQETKHLLLWDCGPTPACSRVFISQLSLGSPSYWHQAGPCPWQHGSQKMTLTSLLECPLPQDSSHTLEGAKEGLHRVYLTPELAILPFTHQTLFPPSPTLFMTLIRFYL